MNHGDNSALSLMFLRHQSEITNINFINLQYDVLCISHLAKNQFSPSVTIEVIHYLQASYNWFK